MRAPDPVLLHDLRAMLAPDRVLARPLDRLGRAGDASIYRLIPEAVVRPRDLGEVRSLLAYASSHRRHLTFRAAGTSLSGQAVTDDLLVELTPYWRGAQVLDGGARVRAQPGVIGAHLNRMLAPHGRRIGPDPASIDAAMIGGIVANNSSGMCCGVVQNSYHTLEGATILLADGTLVDTKHPDADERLRRQRPGLHASLRSLRDEVRANAPLAARVGRKFSRKNTTGYSLNAFLDYDRPADLLAHLLVGSQGTLGFLADVTLRTVPDPPHRATGLIYFADLAQAGAAVAPLAEAGAAALEIMDAASLRAQADDRAYPFVIEDRMAALLTEFRAEDVGDLQAMVARGERALTPFDPLLAPRFSREPAERDDFWRLRKGLAARAGATRPPGTAFLTEDVAVPVERLAEAIGDFQTMFREYGVPDTILFGHAKDGNLHFVLFEDIRSEVAVERYGRFMQGVVDLVVGKYDGAIKAEHGSGRNMAPFVRTEWGGDAYDLMRRVKDLLDPEGILNPGVLLNDDPRVHLKHLKPMTTISPLADRCIECGVCEARCPSRDLTLTPRQRIVVTRELTRLAAEGSPAAREVRDAVLADFAFEGIATCAGDSMCQTSCPVKIDTGLLMKELKAATQPAWARSAALFLARHFGFTAGLARLGLRALALVRALPFGPQLVEAGTLLLDGVGSSLVPRLQQLPSPAPPLPTPSRSGGRRVVYFPSCLSRILGPEAGETRVATARAATDVLQWAGLDASTPEGVRGLCCGMPFASKAFSEAAAVAATRTAEALWRASREGQDPIVTDASPCAGFLQQEAVRLLAESGRTVRLFDFTAFWAREVLPGLAKVPQRPGVAVLHPTCTLVKMGGLPDLLTVARAHREGVVVPRNAECCGFAGDRGFFVPELTRSATAAEAAEVRGLLEANDGAAGLYSTCRTCEMGMTRAVGRSYGSVIHLIHEAVRGA